MARETIDGLRVHSIRLSLLAVWLVAAATCRPEASRAGRPFATDDAGVVGNHAAQVETWLRADEIARQHSIVAAFGPLLPLELAVGGVYGLASNGDGWNAAASAPVVPSGGSDRSSLLQGVGEHVQLDATAGTGLSGDPRPTLWVTVGVKLVTSPLW